MTVDPYEAPSLQSGYSGEQKFPPELKEEADGVGVTQTPQSAGENRGRRAPRHGSGAVTGSGAGAGGGGGPEDYDTDV